MPHRGSRNPPFMRPRQRGKAHVHEKRPTPAGRKRHGISTDTVEKGGFHGRSSVLPRQQKSPPSAAAAARKGSRGRKPVRRPRAENARESARIWRKGWFPRRGTSVLPRQQKSPTSAAAATREGSGGRKPVRRPRAENARESARIRWKRVVPTAEAEPCRGSRNHPPSAAAATRKGSRGRKPVRRPSAENARESARIRGRGRFPHPGTSLLPRQQKSATSAAAATREKLWRSPGPVYCRGPGGGYVPQVYWGVKEGSHPMSCRGSRNRPLLLPRQRGKTVALSGSCVLQGSRRGLWPSGILGGEARLGTGVLPRQQK